MSERVDRPLYDITSPTNPRLRRFAALKRRGDRAAEGRCLLEGVRVIEGALENGATIAAALCTPDLEDSPRGQALLERLRAGGGRVWRVPPALLRAVADTETPQGIVAIASIPAPSLAWAASPGALGIVLDRLQDPGNAGTIARTAAAAGCDGIVVVTGTTDLFGPKAVRAASGALFRLAWAAVGSPAEGAMALRAHGLTLIAADPAGEELYTAVDWRRPAALVVGNEPNGLDEAWRAAADHRVRIPLAPGAESLNAAVAAGVILFEAVRQRLTCRSYERMV